MSTNRISREGSLNSQGGPPSATYSELEFDDDELDINGATGSAATSRLITSAITGRRHTPATSVHTGKALSLCLSICVSISLCLSLPSLSLSVSLYLHLYLCLPYSTNTPSVRNFCPLSVSRPTR
jgi:hypothetical protein